MAGSIPTVSFLAAWTKFRTNPSDDIIVELSRSINVSSKLCSNLRIPKSKQLLLVFQVVMISFIWKLPN